MKKKLLSLALALAMCLGLMVPAMASVETNVAEATAAEEVYITMNVGDTEATDDLGNTYRLSNPVIGSELYTLVYYPDKTITVYLVPIGTKLTIEKADGTPVQQAMVESDEAASLEDLPLTVFEGEFWVIGPDGGMTVYYLALKAVEADSVSEPPAPEEKPSTPSTPTTPPAPTGTPKFSDVSPSSWYAEPVEWAVAQGITTGTSNTTFSPNDTCTHTQILTFLWRAKGQPEPAGTGSSSFNISPSDYYYKAVLWAEENNLFAHVFNTDLTKSCTRQETVLYLWSLAGHPSGADISFTDVPAGSANYAAVSWAVDQGITTGTSDTTFSPDGTCTRAEIVTFLYRAFANK